MKQDIDRRGFIQTMSIAALGAAVGVTIVEQFVQAKDVVRVPSNEQTLERWLLDTGRRTLDNNIYSDVAQGL